MGTMEKITEHTYGAHIYMKLRLDDGAVEEIDVYFPDGGPRYKTSGDGAETRRDEIISAFQALY